MLRVLAASIGISEETTVAPVAVPALSSAFLQTCFYIAAQSQQPSRARVGGPRALRDGRVLRERPVDGCAAGIIKAKLPKAVAADRNAEAVKRGVGAAAALPRQP